MTSGFGPEDWRFDPSPGNKNCPEEPSRETEEVQDNIAKSRRYFIPVVGISKWG